MSIALLGGNQSMRVTTGFLNSVSDPLPGVVIAQSEFAGGIVQSYPGQVGGRLHLDTAQALKLSLVATGTLYDGIYMYVKFKAGSTAANLKGQIVFWDDRATYTVTPDAAAGNIMFPAGIALNAVDKGEYGFIQIAGKATVKFRAAITKAAPAIGDLVVVDASPTNTGDVLADATGLTSLTARTAIGTAIEAPANGVVKLVQLGWALGNLVL